MTSKKSLNAPFGARCLLTITGHIALMVEHVLMHLLVLGAF